MPVTHKFFCDFCHRYILADTLPRLAVTLNAHNQGLHPEVKLPYSPAEIQNSVNYSAMMQAPTYVEKIVAKDSGMSWGTARKPPVITEEDRKLLAAGRVKW
jgi:hypothetical protein